MVRVTLRAPGVIGLNSGLPLLSIIGLPLPSTARVGTPAGVLTMVSLVRVAEPYSAPRFLRLVRVISTMLVSMVTLRIVDSVGSMMRTNICTPNWRA